MAAIITGQAVAIDFRLAAVTVEVIVEGGEVGFGGDAVIVRIDGDQAYAPLPPLLPRDSMPLPVISRDTPFW